MTRLWYGLMTGFGTDFRLPTLNVLSLKSVASSCLSKLVVPPANSRSSRCSTPARELAGDLGSRKDDKRGLTSRGVALGEVRPGIRHLKASIRGCGQLQEVAGIGSWHVGDVAIG